MTKFLAALAGFGLGLSLTASALACYTDDGDLYSMNAEKSQVTVKTASAEKTFTLKKDTKISLNGKQVALADLKSGDKVVVKSEAADDVLEVIATRSS